ncbi:winged helix-turn-helix transcriptional regulator [Gordonia sputi]|uniref:Putative HxlR family transcriptional regulator n=1 Tax=Gordonia sputi NBRC 100414 TaxID=1089453 RepID=H5TZ57_9ACTN|nr:helix-turn-helix domain-containing protein [Gordonia sputi]NKY93918.1 helix-turn-helix transcriptional regulator [Gordonia sputi]GAB38765.1 putative HxlR family transcriptional regulator [Gordonia sputi NBRC 100414]
MAKAYDVMAATCPSRVVLHRIGARWTVFVVTALSDGPMRFSALKAHIEGITPKVLTETLRALNYDGLVDRLDFGGQPPHVEYQLTDLGRSLLVPLAAVRAWAEDHVPDVEDAHRRFDDDLAPRRTDGSAPIG